MKATKRKKGERKKNYYSIIISKIRVYINFNNILHVYLYIKKKRDDGNYITYILYAQCVDMHTNTQNT